jgi:hypothetical protein
MSKRAEPSQSSVEFALVFPLVLLAVWLVVQSAVIVRDQLALWRAAGTAARLASIDPTDEVGIHDVVNDQLHLRKVEVEIDRASPLVTVTLSSPYEIRMWFVGVRLFTMKASATMYEEAVG